ncbi:MAG: thiamine pyrophosphate-dependent dehydrogenase E1 component subunit alpha [Deltaproteobacteria bacterium]|nr:thiamine pyrophosphate-dependent dehydrogenase E1 component subunit alpha [Deltaproteobacteria bacterium]MBT4641339.1 thiamine pyrophosphate-dependent dehydrogenase E1 component subunit alpha [Deltaproteobacteria bacterium]MBT7150842.1 thiamine pyrophosphate-dependent dehydrogenase E1 component subunit alpha [Deltaproteobacteria bacterium]MBT7888846.1 thiamine pyrophosphate-dependent dehydrogenase E1 component subunit alpha [Deltaproteobacteria bacterium]
MSEKRKKTNRLKIDRKRSIKLYSMMVKIRRVEETLAEVFTAGEIPGFIHTCIGQEATPTAVCSHLEQSDYITTTHRGHGHALAKGVDLKMFMAELFGRRDGLCRGRSGSIHLADKSCGLLGANGIVGAGIPLATGAAFASQYKNSGQVAVCFFGEAASDEGFFHESLNIASLWKLPIVYVCENNGWAQFTPQKVHMPVQDVAQRAVAYGINGITVTNDILEIEAAAAKALSKARKGGGPTLLEVKSLRWHGHYVGDPQKYRSQKEVTLAQKDDCIKKFKTWLIKSNYLDQVKLDGIESKIEKEITKAVEFARQSPVADTSELMESLYVV